MNETGHDLVSFLRARLDEDERVAQAAVIPAHDAPNAYKPHPPLARWRYVDGGDVEVDWDDPGPYSETWRVTADSEGGQSVSDTDGHHIARYDPARMLAEVDAKRRVIDEYELMVNTIYTGDETSSAAIVEPFIRLLALPYADHPDYDEAWRPA